MYKPQGSARCEVEDASTQITLQIWAESMASLSRAQNCLLLLMQTANTVKSSRSKINSPGITAHLKNVDTACPHHQDIQTYPHKNTLNINVRIGKGQTHLMDNTGPFELFIKYVLVFLYTWIPANKHIFLLFLWFSKKWTCYLERGTHPGARRRKFGGALTKVYHKTLSFNMQYKCNSTWDWESEHIMNAPPTSSTSLWEHYSEVWIWETLRRPPEKQKEREKRGTFVFSSCTQTKP